MDLATVFNRIYSSNKQPWQYVIFVVVSQQPLMDELPEYAALCKANKNVNMLEEFSKDPERAGKFSCRVDLANGDFLFHDYSKNLITPETKELLLKLAKASKVEEWRERMFKGEHINQTEDRAVLHVALRERNLLEVQEELEKMVRISNCVRNGEWKQNYPGAKAVTDVVNIGIGGSDLGPAMAVQALGTNSNIRVHFVSNVDGTHLQRTLQNLNPQTTLFIVVSKTFTTKETMLNADSAKEWLELNGICDTEHHFIAVSSNQEEVKNFGAKECLSIWNWVGGRYSLWSAVGLSIMIAIGSEGFVEMLEGGRLMDDHFRNAPLEKNLPVVSALVGIWYRNFMDASTFAVIPYEQALSRLPAYLQQLDMESNGKQAAKNGKTVNYKTGPIVWGQPGTNGQHAFFQHLHQGSDLVPIEFLVGLHPPPSSELPPINPPTDKPFDYHHIALYANCLAQSEALMVGKSCPEDINRHFPGNKPSNTLVYNRLTPRTLGALIAYYEHRTFVQGVIWGINSFDQFGVELGKKLEKDIHENIMRAQFLRHDPSTEQLLKLYFKDQNRAWCRPANV